VTDHHRGDPAGDPAGDLSGAVSSELPGIAVDRVTTWLTSHVAGATAPFTFSLIAGGHSNLTYRVTGADGTDYVLRRPPLGHLLASAHDVGREHRIIAALAGTAVPVAPALGFCDDPTVNGAPFYVMAFVDGNVVRDRATAESTLTVAQRAVAGRSLADTLAAIHAVDLEAVGLGDLGRHEGYVARQLKRWYGQWNAQKTRELPAIDRVHDALATHVPDQLGATIVHGDYRLDNCMLGTDATVAAVLDWEICTLGDPMADVGLLMVYWTGPDDSASAWEGQASTAPGFPNRVDLLQMYATGSGRDVDGVGYYVAFAYWKLACILEGVYARYLGGALGERDRDELAPFERQVTAAATMAADELAGLGLL
jgi:aminoglycoside phosphotransferase (APT) family kinase protein